MSIPDSDASSLVQALEARSFRAWPALETVQQGDWCLRASGGFTKRANSANATVAGADFDGVRAAAETFYARRCLPAVFRLSPLAPPEADAALARSGYRFADPSRVMHGPLAAAAPDRQVTIARRPATDWCDGFAAANGVPLAHRAVHDVMLRSIAVPALFATVWQGGTPAGYALAVVDGGMVGLYDVVIATALRGRGFGGRLVRALLHAAASQGATSAYLQVRDPNLPARRLYTGLGLSDTYAYHYRLPPG